MFRRSIYHQALGALVLACWFWGCGESTDYSPPDEAQGEPGADTGTGECVLVDNQAPVVVGTAIANDEHILELPVTSSSRTSWAEVGNEALILEVMVDGVLRGHLVLHQGADGFTYRMAMGQLNALQAVSVVVSDLSAANATPSACVGPATLTPSASLADPEQLLRTPIIKWPRKKRFDDLPAVLGWSQARQEYQMVFTSENGGTVKNCGGGAEGIQAEIARWGRAVDIEGIYKYANGVETWNRCTEKTDMVTHPVRKEGSHPVFYYGDGHNRLFESRGGSGNDCGTDQPEKADGDLQGWNVNNPGNDPDLDDPYVITIRLVPDLLDAYGFDEHQGRREALVDKYAPWLYRILDHELMREGKIDGSQALNMQQYLYADVYAADVGGSGDQYCSFWGMSGGFVLRVIASDTTLDGPQMTADYFGGQNDVKRIAIPLDQVYDGSQFSILIFDAYDDDGIYWLKTGDVFVPRPQGDNGATIDLVHSGKTEINVYVDDDRSSCSNGVNNDGPDGPAPCVGSYYRFIL